MKTEILPFKETTKTIAEAQWQNYAAAARRFALDWAHEMDEKGEAHSFWDEFLLIFNIRRRNFARHEAICLRTWQLVTNTDMLKNVWLTQFCSN